MRALTQISIVCLVLALVMLTTARVAKAIPLAVPQTVETIPDKTPYKLVCKRDRCDLFLGPVIGSDDNYVKLFEQLPLLPAKTVLVVHLAGRGGLVSSMDRLISALRTTKAQVIGLVEGEVASAHATLAISIPKLYSNPHTLFMFHKPALQNGVTIKQVCSEYKGQKDRGIDVELKCLNDMEAHIEAGTAHILELLDGKLTKEEIQKFKQGHDIYKTAKELGIPPLQPI